MIAGGEVRLLTLPFRTPHESAEGRRLTRHAVVLCLRDDAGNRGWAECVADDTPYTAPETARSAFDALTKGALSGDFSDRPLIAATVAGAIADLAAVRAGRPLVAEYGGTPGPVEVGAVVATADPHSAVERAGTLLDAGYRRIRVKVDASWADPWGPAVAIRTEFPNAPMAADANESFSLATLDVDILEALDLDFFEQPFSRSRLDEHARLRRMSSTPVCLDESVRSTGAVERAADAGALDMVALKPGMVGGVEAAIEMAAVAAGRGLDTWVGGMLETGIGRAHSLALARCIRSTIPADLPGSDLYFDPDVTTSWSAIDGRIHVPATVGLGQTVDGRALDRYTDERREVG